MLIFGELRDKKLCEEIVRDLKLEGIDVRTEYNPIEDMTILFVIDDQNFEKAQDYFRLKMGFFKPPKIDQEWIKIKKIPRGDVTFLVMIFCGLLYVASFGAVGKELYRNLFIGSAETGFLYEVMHGQIWRLLTPIFLHMGLLHVLFNMLWFKDLGYLIEHSFKKYFLVVFIFSVGVLSNVFQVIVSGPEFGGMSGVLYGMLGFVWVYKKINSEYEYDIPSFDLKMMIAWYFICLIGLIGPIANTAHGIGLAVGMIFGVFKNQQKFTKIHFKYLSYSLLFFIVTLGIEGLKLYLNNSKFYLLRFLEG